jgi:hypothetical protein
VRHLLENLIKTLLRSHVQDFKGSVEKVSPVFEIKPQQAVALKGKAFWTKYIFPHLVIAVG